MIITCVHIGLLTHGIIHLSTGLNQNPILQVVLIETAISLAKERYTIYSTETNMQHRQCLKQGTSFKGNQSYLSYSVIAIGFPKPNNVIVRKLNTLSLRIKGAQNISPSLAYKTKQNKKQTNKFNHRLHTVRC